MLSYFDSSFLLSILLNESRADEALNVWKNSYVRLSSIILKFETNISLRRSFAFNLNKHNGYSFNVKLAELNEFLDDVLYINITENFENSVSKNYDNLSKCKSLDAIHIATAIDISEKYDRKEIRLCSFDKKMLALAKEFGFETVGG